jgi:hypothetical protein
MRADLGFTPKQSYGLHSVALPRRHMVHTGRYSQLFCMAEEQLDGQEKIRTDYALIVA